MLMDRSLGVHPSDPRCKTAWLMLCEKNVSSCSTKTLGTSGAEPLMLWDDWNQVLSKPGVPHMVLHNITCTHPAFFCGISWHAGVYVCTPNYVFDKWSYRSYLLGRGDVHCSRGNGIEWSKMKHSSEEVDRWLYHVRADVAREGQGDDVLFNDIWEQYVNTNGCFHFSSSLCPRVLLWVSTVWCLGWNKKTDESRYDVCPVLLLPLHHRASTAWVMMMRAGRTGAYYFTMLKDNGPASYGVEESAQASNYCL